MTLVETMFKLMEDIQFAKQALERNKQLSKRLDRRMGMQKRLQLVKVS